MPGKTVKISGRNAVLVLIVATAFVGFRFVTARSKIDGQGRATLQTWVQDQVVRPILGDTTRSEEERGAAASAGVSAVQIKSLQVHGPLNRAIVRVELAPSPALPAGTKLLRYYRMQYSDLTGWRVVGSARAWDWYLALF